MSIVTRMDETIHEANFQTVPKQDEPSIGPILDAGKRGQKFISIRFERPRKLLRVQSLKELKNGS